MNPFRHLLKAAGAHPPVGTWVVSSNALAAEALGHAGFDWVVLDLEHTTTDLGDLVHLLQAVGNTRMVPVVRLPWNEPVMVKRVLDAGALTVMFPFVQNAEEARRAVAATRYPPEGVRGVMGLSRATRYGTATQALRHANQSVGVIVQIETREALDDLEAIATVPGVDAVFVGPADLSASLGHLGEPAHPQVMELLARAVDRCRALDRPVGTMGASAELVAQYRAMGFDFVGVGSDLGLMMRGAQAALSALRTQDTTIVHSVTAGTLTR